MNVVGALKFVIGALLELYILVFVIRFLMQWARADFRNPLSQAIVQISNPLVVPLRKVIPGWGGLDIATLVAVFSLQILGIIIFSAFRFDNPLALGIPKILGYASLRVLHVFLSVILFLVFIRVILSWISPGSYNPMISLIHSVTEPIMAPVRRLVPSLGGLDISPLLIFIGIGALKVLFPLKFVFF